MSKQSAEEQTSSGSGGTGRPVVLVAGPTASGKSALALRLAEEFTGTVINADSMQMYRELRVLTARPSAAEEARAPHRLYGVLAAAEAGSAARWRDMALAEIAAADAAGRLPILVGGTGLYFRVLLNGLAEVPDVPAEIRAEARALRAAQGAEEFHALLATRDPVAAARLAPGDTQRLLRAYEVVASTGVPLAEWQRRPPTGPTFDRRVAILVLAPPRPQLYAACDARFGVMLEQGALAEVVGLNALGLDPMLPAMKAVGVPELRRHLAGKLTLDAAATLARQATRRYAKRQGTWFRRQINASALIEEQFMESHELEIFSFVRRFLLTTLV